ncbi:ATP-binding protein [Paenibacillus sp. Y412MC10]|uniref:ATP-binding protein n=1 Tax=Geobacillus sp. (strain Y412MC10) TaxID=481743 RepID=UPI0016424A9D|nr:ATP-binding protein [Paenibacillus sp. Y412MC10]
MRKIIFLAGIHGVGKSYLSKIIAREFDIDHFSASSLIARLKEQQFTENKAVEDIKDNQSILLESINKYTSDNSTFILDGHFCLLNQNNEVARIPKTTFLSLPIVAVIVLAENIHVIAERLNLRDKKNYDQSMLKVFQNAELEYSQDISALLNVPLLITNNKENDYLDFIKNKLF